MVETSKLAEALIKAEGSVPKAARALGMKPSELRTLIKAEPQLLDAALEASELALDEAEAELLHAMRTGPLADRLQAAAFLRRPRRARDPSCR